MKHLFLVLTTSLVLGIVSCTNVPVTGVTPVSTTGQDLNSLAAQATQAYVDYKAGNVNYAWGIAHMLQAYQTIIKTKDDVKALALQWGAGRSYAERLANIFGSSNAPPPVKAKAIAAGVTVTVKDVGNP